MKRISIFALLLLPALAGMAQDKSFGIKFSGFVKTDVFYDTRQSGAANGIREGHFYLFPDGILYDADSNDVNDNAQLHMLSIQTRLKGDISGPDAFGAKTSGVIEAEFFGTSDADLNGFRLRHAYTKLDWSKTSLLVGQTWHPLFPAEAFAGTLSFNTGAPFTPFSRNPQIKVLRTFGKVSAGLTFYGQRDFTSAGPDGNSNKYMRNSTMPGMNLRFLVTPNDKVTIGLGGDYKTLRPELKTTANYITDETISSIAGFAFVKAKTKPVTLSLMGTYAQNATDVMMLGGYGVSEITDTMREFKSYSNLTTMSVWFDISTNGAKTKVGLFGGYSKNLGSDTDTLLTVYGRGTNIDNLMRVSPRILFIRENLTFGAELETTIAAYGTPNPDGTVEVDSDMQTMNIRFLLCAIYKF